MQRIIIAPDSYKECLDSFQVSAAIAEGVRRVLPNTEIIQIPLADGGEGLGECLLSACDGVRHPCVTTDPLGKSIIAEWIALNNNTAVIEMAAASGLALIPPPNRDALSASSYGTGVLIKAALEAGYQRIIVGVGGSATSDGGAGMAEALGVRLLDQAGTPIKRGARGLLDLAHLDMTELHPAIPRAEIIAACDVTNPLFGPQGAAYVYAPQKGATSDMLPLIDTGLQQLAQAADSALANHPGAGGGGGMGFGLMAFTGAKLVSGLDLVCSLTGFDELAASGADLIITGEGQLNTQSLYGKVPSGVAARAKKYGIPVLAIVGSINLPSKIAANHGISAVMSITPGPISLAESIEKAPELITDATERAMRLICLRT